MLLDCSSITKRMLFLLFFLCASLHGTALASTSPWVWVYSTNTTSYYLNTKNCLLNNQGIEFYTIKEVYADEVTRQNHIRIAARLHPLQDFNDLKEEVILYASVVMHDNNVDEYHYYQHYRYIYYYNSAGSLIAVSKGRPDYWFLLREDTFSHYIDTVARKWSIVSPDYRQSDIDMSIARFIS